jgi:tetratricopeptide (TPR) repeat protein
VNARNRVLVAGLAIAFAGPLLAAGGGSMGATPSVSTPATPEEQAQSAYNAGVRGVRRGDSLEVDAAKQADEAKKSKMLAKARDAYAGALKKFVTATELQPDMHQAWNYRGYLERKRGDYAAALNAYDRALSLQPSYAEAIEYRGQAYLGLNRVSEAKEAYLALYAGNRALADKLLAAMREWVSIKRAGPGEVDTATVDELSSWIDERARIAQQTASLTREGASDGWR